MALTTYTELKAAIATRLHRADLTANIVDYITLAEKRLNRDVRTVAQETESTLTATIGSRSLTLPSLFGTPIALYLTTYLPRIEIPYCLPEHMQALSSNGGPQFWTLDGSVIKTDAPANIAYTYTLRYAAEYDLATTSTNALLTAYPDLYFYGALVEAADELRDNEGMARYQQRYSQALQQCANNENANRSIATLATSLPSSRRPNILTG
jgi:hypothetical protein